MDNGINVVFSNNNTIRKKLVKNSPKPSDDSKTGVYIIPCKDCNQVYVGETGRNLPIRLEEHKRACRMGYANSAVANHSLNLDHRIDFHKATIINSNNIIAQRRVIEGALIHCLDTFEGNKTFSQDDTLTSRYIIKAAKFDLKKLSEISPTSALSLQLPKNSRSFQQAIPQEEDSLDGDNGEETHQSVEPPTPPRQVVESPSPPYQDRPPDRPRRSARILARVTADYT